MADQIIDNVLVNKVRYEASVKMLALILKEAWKEEGHRFLFDALTKSVELCRQDLAYKDNDGAFAEQNDFYCNGMSQVINEASANMEQIERDIYHNFSPELNTESHILICGTQVQVTEGEHAGEYGMIGAVRADGACYAIDLRLGSTIEVSILSVREL